MYFSAGHSQPVRPEVVEGAPVRSLKTRKLRTQANTRSRSLQPTGARRRFQESRLSWFFIGIDAAFDLGHSFAMPNDHDRDYHGGGGDNGDGAYTRTKHFGTHDSVEPIRRLGLCKERSVKHGSSTK